MSNASPSQAAALLRGITTLLERCFPSGHSATPCIRTCIRKAATAFLKSGPELSVWPHLTCSPGPCGRWTPRCRPRSRNSLIQAVLEALSLEVVRMVINLYNGGEDACAPVAIVPLPSIFEFDSEMRVLRPEGGAFTTGGTEPASHALSMHFSSQVHLS